MGKLRFISACNECFFNKSEFYRFFSITIKYQNSIFIKYIKKFEISLGRLIVGGTCLFSKARTILETVPILSSSHERRARLLGRCSMNETRVLGQFLSGRYRSVLRIENKLGYYEKHEELAKQLINEAIIINFHDYNCLEEEFFILPSFLFLASITHL